MGGEYSCSEIELIIYAQDEEEAEEIAREEIQNSLIVETIEIKEKGAENE